MFVERRVFCADYNFAEDRRSYSAEFKAQVALEALASDKSNMEIAMEYNLHSHQVMMWKQQLLNNAAKAFETGANLQVNLQVVPNKPAEKSHAKIGQLIAENDFLTKVLGR